MKNVALMLVTVFLLVSCKSQGLSFKRMSEEEIATYNRTVGFEEQIHCIDDVHTGSYIRRKSCATIPDWVELGANVYPVSHSLAK